MKCEFCELGGSHNHNDAEMVIEASASENGSAICFRACGEATCLWKAIEQAKLTPFAKKPKFQLKLFFL